MASQPPICFTDAGTLELQGMVGKIRRYSLIPNAQNTWTNDVLVLSLDDSFKNSVIELINSLNEEYFVELRDYPIPNGGWDGTIPIPADSIGLDLRDIWTSNQPASTPTPFIWTECTRINPNSQSPYAGCVGGNFWLTPGRGGLRYYVENNRIQFILPPNTQTNQLGITFVRFRYFKKPATLVSRSCCAVVTAVDTVANTITLDKSNSPSVQGTNYNPYYPYTTGMTFDFIQNIQPYVYDTADVTPVSVTVNPGNQVLVVDAATAAAVSVGDICCPTGTAPVLQYVPEEAINVLCQAVVVRYADGQGNDTQLQRANQQLQVYTQILQRLLTPKVLDQTKVTTSANDLFSNDSMNTSGGYSYGNGT